MTKNTWITRWLSEDDQILKEIKAEPGVYQIKLDTSAKAIKIKDERKEYEAISLAKSKSQYALMMLKEYKKIELSEAIQGKPYRFNCALQTGENTVVSENGLFHNKPPTAKEAIEVLERLRVKGKRFLPNKAHENFDTAINGVIGSLKQLSPTGCTPDGGYDITDARRKFEYKGTEYRVDIKACGKTSGESWFK